MLDLLPPLYKWSFCTLKVRKVRILAEFRNQGYRMAHKNYWTGNLYEIDSFVLDFS